MFESCWEQRRVARVKRMQRFGASQNQLPVRQPEQHRAMKYQKSQLSSDLWGVKLYADRQHQDTST